MTIGDVLQGAPGAVCDYLWNIQGPFKDTPILANWHRSQHLCAPKIVGNSLYNTPIEGVPSPFSCWTNTPESVLSPTTSSDTGPEPVDDEKALNGCWDPKERPLSVITDTYQPLETLTQRPTDTRGTKRFRKQYTIDPHLHILSTYRISSCKHGTECRARAQCTGFHNKGERRRDPRVHSYKPELCPPNGDADDPSYARNRTEVMYHPEVFKTRLCNGTCGKSTRYCAFAHGQGDVFKYEDSWPY